MRTSSGFTLPELVVTLVIIGIMAVVVVPRFANRAEFDAFGFAEQTRAALRFAQKSAIAKRRNVCGTIEADNSLSLTFGTNFRDSCSGLTCAVNPANCLKNPGTGQDYTLPAQTGVTVTASGFSFNALGQAIFSFNALGQPINALGQPSPTQTLNVRGGSSTQTITVEAETGYVY